jgi:hypothetical protein
MPLCGFNQEMLEGLERFHEGLVEQIVVKTEESENGEDK